jgi:dinuclear metal center YbgI/SA1388 family protein
VPTVREITDSIAAHTRPETTPEWDPVGLQLGDPGVEVGSVAVCHEVNEAVIERLEKAGPVDLLVTYHPLLFKPTNRITAGHSPGARSYRLIRMGINLVVTHTDFDSAPGGMADALAAFFDLRRIQPFGEDVESGLPAIGRFGSFEGTIARIDAMATDAFGPIGIRISGDRNREVESLAVVPGSGSRLIEAAAEVADVLVTGDVGHHDAVAARDLGLSIVDPGHVATERPGMSRLVALVREVTGLDVVDLTSIDPQTWG